MYVEEHMEGEKEHNQVGIYMHLGTKMSISPHWKRDTQWRFKKKEEEEVFGSEQCYLPLWAGTVKSVDLEECFCFTEELNSQEGTK